MQIVDMITCRAVLMAQKKQWASHLSTQGNEETMKAKQWNHTTRFPPEHPTPSGSRLTSDPAMPAPQERDAAGRVLKHLDFVW